MSSKDEIYREPMRSVPPFEFNHEVAQVFDDMATRSIPFYWQTQQLVADIFSQTYRCKGTLYDLGCSTGNSIYTIAKKLNTEKLSLSGLDSSLPMIEKCRESLGRYRLKGYISIEQGDALNTPLLNAEGVLLNYLLQFIPPASKLPLLKKIYASLPTGGVLVLSDKISHPTDVKSIFDKLYYRYKSSQGYSELEIAQKREALEETLLPLSRQELEEHLREAGFTQINAVFQWTHFVTLLAIK